MAKEVFLEENEEEKKDNDIKLLRSEIKKWSEEIFKKRSICAEENRRRGAILQKISELKSLLEQAEMDNFLKRRR